MRDAAAPDERVKWSTARGSLEPAGRVGRRGGRVSSLALVDHPAGVAEARRILARAALRRSTTSRRTRPFTAAYGAVVMKYATDATEQRRANALAAFAAIDPARTKRFEYGNVHMLDRAGVHQRADSSSYLPKGTMPRAMHDELDGLVDAFEHDGVVKMHLVTLVVRVDG